MKPAPRLAAPVVLALGLSACAPTYAVHGFAPSETDLARVEAGLDDRASTLRKLGQPSTIGAIDGGEWYYVQSRVKNFAFYAPQVVEREVVAVLFDEAGQVESVRRFGMEQGKIIDLETRITPTYGRELTVIQQIFGNFGQISTEQLLNR